MRKTVIALVALLALGVVACSGKYKPQSPAEGGSTAETGATGSSGAVPAGCEDLTGGDATITISGFTYPSCIQVSAGSTITVVNEDPSAHSFSIDGTDIDETLDVGDTVKVKLTGIAPGEYHFHCRFHAPMKGTLIIT